MPASVAHMLILEDVISEIETENGYDDLVKVLKDYKQYGMLGSVGPDLPYYGILANVTMYEIAKMVWRGSDLPAGIEKWSGQLHSKDPNIFPLKMMEIACREKTIDANKWDEISMKQWAFIAGFLTHIAADQILHPFVNKIVHQYYRDDKNRKNHRNCEVYQDVVLFSIKRNKSILDEPLMKWAAIPGNNCTEPYFRVFLQKAFDEAHSIHPSEREIDNWVKGYLSLLRFFVDVVLGPYRNAAKDYEMKKEKSERFKKYWLNNDGRPYEDVYKEAVELALIYIKTAYHIFLKESPDIDDKKRRIFLDVVRNADLTNPLDKNILVDARKNYDEYIG